MKILVISFAGIGDTLLATPLIRELRANFPDAVIDALVRWPGARDFIENNPHLNHVFQKDLVRESRLEALRFLSSLRKQRYDVSINTHPQSRIHYRLIARLTGARMRISHEYECSGLVDRFLVNRTLPQDYTKHTVENNLALLSFLGVQPRSKKRDMEVFLTAAEEQWAQDFLQTHGLVQRKRLGVHVGSGSTKNLKLKRWPFENYVRLIEQLNRERPDVAVMLFGGPEERADNEIISRRANPRLVLQPETGNFRQAAALLKTCDAFLSVDTVLMHLAAAMKVPGQVVIEAPTLNVTNLPYGNPFLLVSNPIVAGRNLDYYRYDGLDIKGTDDELKRCMASVSVEAVRARVSEAIG